MKTKGIIAIPMKILLLYNIQDHAYHFMSYIISQRAVPGFT